MSPPWRTPLFPLLALLCPLFLILASSISAGAGSPASFVVAPAAAPLLHEDSRRRATTRPLSPVSRGVSTSSGDVDGLRLAGRHHAQGQPTMPHRGACRRQIFIGSMVVSSKRDSVSEAAMSPSPGSSRIDEDGVVEEYKQTPDGDDDADPARIRRSQSWVVLVDDEESIRLAVGDYLYHCGYQVTACADADALLETCATPRSDGTLPDVPACIVSDVRMPGKNGLELLGLLRADERLSRVPVVLLTAKSMTQDRIEGYKAGADAYLAKPFAPEELLSIVDNAIARRAQMTGPNAKLVDLKADMSNIKQILRKNGEGVVKATDVHLTPAERDALECLARGYTNGEIASELGVGVILINRRIQDLYLKTQTRTRTELVRWAIQTGHVSVR